MINNAAFSAIRLCVLLFSFGFPFATCSAAFFDGHVHPNSINTKESFVVSSNHGTGKSYLWQHLKKARLSIEEQSTLIVEIDNTKLQRALEVFIKDKGGRKDDGELVVKYWQEKDMLGFMIEQLVNSVLDKFDKLDVNCLTENERYNLGNMIYSYCSSDSKPCLDLKKSKKLPTLLASTLDVKELAKMHDTVLERKEDLLRCVNIVKKAGFKEIIFVIDEIDKAPLFGMSEIGSICSAKSFTKVIQSTKPLLDMATLGQIQLFLFVLNCNDIKIEEVLPNFNTDKVRHFKLEWNENVLDSYKHFLFYSWLEKQRGKRDRDSLPSSFSELVGGDDCAKIFLDGVSQSREFNDIFLEFEELLLNDNVTRGSKDCFTVKEAIKSQKQKAKINGSSIKEDRDQIVDEEEKTSPYDKVFFFLNENKSYIVVIGTIVIATAIIVVVVWWCGGSSTPDGVVYADPDGPRDAYICGPEYTGPMN